MSERIARATVTCIGPTGGAALTNARMITPDPGAPVDCGPGVELR